MSPTFSLEHTEPDNDGILPKQQLETAAARGLIKAAQGISTGQFQPASVDLRLGARAFKLPAGFLPGRKHSVSDKINEFFSHSLDLSGKHGAVLEIGCIYLIELQESLALSQNISGRCNPKSTTGRLDVFCRVLSDNSNVFDSIQPGYTGKLYLEVTPRSFPIRARTGDTLAQIRLARHGGGQQIEPREMLVTIGLQNLASEHASSDGANARCEDQIVGYRAKRFTGVIDLREINQYDSSEFWDTVKAGHKGRVLLEPDAFYIFASRDRIIIPPNEAAEMAPFDAGIGEFRAHYAGFFDPGFGYNDGATGARAVLEVRGRDIPFVLEDDQPVARLIYERLSGTPTSLYGKESGSNYQVHGKKMQKPQDLRLAKQFKVHNNKTPRISSKKTSEIEEKPPVENARISKQQDSFLS